MKCTYSNVLLALLIALGGCSNIDYAELSNCPNSGEARLGGIPIASRSEHELARRFAPQDPNNCLIYVGRGRVGGASYSETMVFLTEAEAHKPVFTPSRMYADHRDRVATIFDDVYALWELPAGMYFVTAIYSKYVLSGGRDATYDGLQGFQQLIEMSPKFYEGAYRQVERYCPAGGMLFMAVSDSGYGEMSIQELDEEQGRSYVVGGIRSVGPADSYDPWYNFCPKTQQ